MFKNLFSLEDQEENLDSDNNELLIDKVLEYSKKSKSPISVTKDIIKERQNLKKEILNKLQDEEEEPSEETEKDDDSSKQDTTEEDTSESEVEDKEDKEPEAKEEAPKEEPAETEKDAKDDNDETEKDTKTEKPADGKEEEDISKAASSESDLEAHIGSGLKNKETPAKESIHIPEVSRYKLSVATIFKPLQNLQSKYIASLEEYNVRYRMALEEQPIAYTKEAVIESINNLVKMSENYTDKNKLMVESRTKSSSTINEKLTIIKHFIDESKYSFTSKLVEESDILSSLLSTRASDLRTSSRDIHRYVTNANKLALFILTNPFESIKNGLANSNFISEEEDYIYKEQLPGFNVIRAHIDNYDNYLKTKIEDYNYYKVRTFKTADLYAAPSISITEETDIKYILEISDKLLIELTMTIDNFKIIADNLTKLIDSLKAIAYDVEQDKYKNFTAIGIDKFVQDFIKFKLIFEIYSINTDELVHYLLNILTVINTTIKLEE